VGISPNHASSVHLVRNLQTGSITPQFHLVFDDFFETVFSEGEQEPDVWPELVHWLCFKVSHMISTMMTIDPSSLMNG
jgi:hypothetical protein